MLRWLTLNYLAVLKITKKHDKHCGTALLPAISKVLISQPFVAALRSDVWTDERSRVESCDVGPTPPTHPPPPQDAYDSSDDDEIAGPSGAEGDPSMALQIEQLLGSGSGHYLPGHLLRVRAPPPPPPRTFVRPVTAREAGAVTAGGVAMAAL